MSNSQTDAFNNVHKSMNKFAEALRVTMLPLLEQVREGLEQVHSCLEVEAEKHGMTVEEYIAYTSAKMQLHREVEELRTDYLFRKSLQDIALKQAKRG